MRSCATHGTGFFHGTNCLRFLHPHSRRQSTLADRINDPRGLAQHASRFPLSRGAGHAAFDLSGRIKGICRNYQS
ncbi:protein of unknown function [Rhodovastum atsumiense]|nr:protein of unknown function [Rhodovastum atsumiense]